MGIRYHQSFHRGSHSLCFRSAPSVGRTGRTIALNALASSKISCQKYQTYWRQVSCIRWSAETSCVWSPRAQRCFVRDGWNAGARCSHVWLSHCNHRTSYWLCTNIFDTLGRDSSFVWWHAWISDSEASPGFIAWRLDGHSRCSERSSL